MLPTPRLVVVGSANVDLTVETPALPRRGETVLGGDLHRTLGGKGANQAAAASRLGIATSFIGCVGTDEAGDEIIGALAALGVDTTLVQRGSRPTGTALIITNDEADNVIVVSPGANAEVSMGDADLRVFDGVLVQLEIPVATVADVVGRHERVIVNAAPAVAMDEDVLTASAVVIVNETEAEALPMSRIARCVITLGSRGAELRVHGRRAHECRAPRVDVIDTVGAGDVFSAAFTARFLAGDDDADALRYAVCAGSLATLGRGAQGALPTDAEVQSWLQRGW